MGLFDRLNKIWSGADFLDKEENRRQREQFAKEDEEEERRRRAAAAARTQGPKPGTVIQPQQKFDFTSPLSKAAFNNPILNDPSLKATPEQVAENKKETELEELTKKHLERQLEQEKKQTSWFDRQFTDRNWNKRAEARAISSATREFQDKYGWNRDPTVLEYQKGAGEKLDEADKGGTSQWIAPVLSTGRVGTGLVEGAAGLYDLATPGKGQNRLTKASTSKAQEIDQLAKDLEVDKLYKATNVPLEIATYFTPTVVSKGGKIANLTGKVSNKLDDVIKGGGKLRKFGQEAVEEFLDPRNLEKELELTGRYMGQDSARGEDISGGDVASNTLQAVGGAFLPPFVRRALKKFRGQGDEAIEEGATIATGTAGSKVIDNIDDGIKKVPDPEDIPEIPGAVDETPTGPTTVIDDGIKTPTPPKPPTRPRGPRVLEPLPPSKFTELEQLPLIPRVPDVTSPIALAKAADQIPTGAPTAPPDVPIADFRNAVNGSLQKAEPVVPAQVAAEQTPADISEAAARGDLRVSTATDAEGNPTLISDAEAQRQLAEAGVVPQRGASPVAAAEEQMQTAAEQAARQEVDLSGAAAPRLREELASQIKDEDLQADVLEGFNPKNALNLEEAENRAVQAVADASDADLIATFGQRTPAITNATEMFEANLAARRLQTLRTPEADQAVKNIVDGLTRHAEVSGQNLRSIRALYENMPTAMKQQLLIDKLEASTGAELPNAERAELLARIEAADAATEDLRALELEAQDIIDSGLISNKSTPGEVRERVRRLTKTIDDARTNMELRNGEAWRTFQENLPKASMGKRVADVGRTFMLSSPAGRIFDIISTSVTSADDLLTRGTSNLIGKVLNKVPGVGRGRLQDVITSPRKLVKGFREGAERTAGAFKGKDYVEDFMGAAKRATRGDINTGGGRFRRGVRSLVEMPTNLTRGLREEQLFREGMQEAGQRGLKGDARRLYAELRASIPNEKQLYDATQTHLKANMLHDNKISKFLSDNLAKKLDDAGHGWGAVLIRNQVAPFTSWLGGNLHRTLTDKNVLWNAGSIINNARKGNAQGVVDAFSKLAVNSAEAYALGAVLTKAGIITTEDANGDDYAGLYINIGDRYVPVAILGTAAVPLILGNSVEQAAAASAEGENPATAMVNTLAQNLYKNTGVASVFGGENNLQSTLEKVGRGDFTEAITGYGGDLGRQYIPGFTGDINAALDQWDRMNPTGEAVETKVTQENPETGRQVTNVAETELRKTLARIPGVAQTLPRKEGTVAKDLVDRATRGNRESGQQAQEKAAAKSKEEVEKDRKKRGVPETDDGIQAKVEDGDYDLAIEGYRWKIDKAAEDGELSKKSRKKLENEIKRLEITRDLNHSSDVIDSYKDVSLTEWRKMGDPESEDYDPERYQLLFEYDKRLTDAGVSRNEGDPTKTKYYYKDSERGGGKGKGRKPKFATDIATQSGRSFSFQPIKAQGANFAQPQTAIPQLQKVRNFDRSKLKKISVTKGARV